MKDIETESGGGAFSYLKKSFNIIVGNILSAGLSSIFVVIFAVLQYIFKVLFLFLFEIVPFLVKYVGIPLFILGGIMALLFFGGHIFFTVSLIVGIFLYIKGIYTFTFNLSKDNTTNIKVDTPSNTYSGIKSSSSVSYKIKSK